MKLARSFDYMVMAPPGTPDAALPIAGSRAGAIGVLNLEFVEETGVAFEALDWLARHGRGRLGVLLQAQNSDLLTGILRAESLPIDVIIITGVLSDEFKQQVATVREAGRDVFAVARNLVEGEVAQSASVDAIIAKGHEAGGWVGEETSFVLLQRLLTSLQTPIWVQGGIGLHTAAACKVAGAAGVVLDNQLLLTRESPLSTTTKQRIGQMDGSETICLGTTIGDQVRVYNRPDLSPARELEHIERSMLSEKTSQQSKWHTAVSKRVDWKSPEDSVLAIGQDTAFAAELARRFHTVGGIISGIDESVRAHIASARKLDPLGEGSSLAQSHGTRYPIVQGPMTRVSDRAGFAAAVADAGGLPFLALALMRAPDVKELLEETRTLMADQPWGVGILGFVPAELRAEQLEVIQAYRPPFALIAGGRPDQARVLEDDGIATYLHVPSPGLLSLYLRDGARRFVFEGRECGGHVGPRTSFVLWDTMVRILLDELPTGEDPANYHVLFAGGIHDGLSAAMVSAIAAPLAERGMRVGALLGTAYLFTEEVVAHDAITPGFQSAAITSDQTVLLESGPGHATRSLPSPFVDFFNHEKRRLLESDTTAEELRNRLEELNIGRLRIATKGQDRHPDFGKDPSVPKLQSLDPDAQWQHGMYMIGQTAALHSEVLTLADLHAKVSNGSTERLAAELEIEMNEVAPPAPVDVAVVGIGTILPGAPDLKTFWSNILNKVDAIDEIPANRWDWRPYFDPDRNAKDKVYSRWGGFIDDVPFDPLEFGMPPNSLRSIEAFQLLGLKVVQAALDDAGYAERPFARDRTSVILGAGGGGADLTAGYMVRSSLPALFGDAANQLAEELAGRLPDWTEDSFPGILMNVAAGRIANRLDFGGHNYTVDAACASSLAAVYLAVRDLQAKTSDVAVVGGVDAIQNPFAYLCFSKTYALSPNGRCRPFDAEADGIAISEGFAALVLKRLDDAERDGDRIYAVIRGVGGASDGRDRSLTAPRPEGQVRALDRAYENAGFSPATVGLIEAHGTGTVAGDKAEVESLSTAFRRAGATQQGTAIGSVKSMIGHTKATAGVAGMVKTVLGLHHRVLPATLGVSEPNPRADFPRSPFYINTENRPWIQGVQPHPRRAGVSAFGFGGTDYHVVLEEYSGGYLPEREAVVDRWPAELFIWSGQSRVDIITDVTDLLDRLEQGATPRLADLAYTLSIAKAQTAEDQMILAIVASSHDDLIKKLKQARDTLKSDSPRIHAPNGIHFAERPLGSEGKLAFLFPGQGSQSIDMARDLTLAFPEMRETFERADRAVADRLERPLSEYIFPPPAFSAEDKSQQQAALTETNIAQPALGATALGYLYLLHSLGIEADMAAGHSYGEFVALRAAGVLDEEQLFLLSEARGRFMREGAGEDSGTMAAVSASPEQLEPLMEGSDLTLANLNSPTQTVISGSRAGIEQAIAWCSEHGLRAKQLPVACAFHSPFVAPAQDRLTKLLDTLSIAEARFPVYSNTTAQPYPDDREAMTRLISEHMTSPVQFVGEVEAMYDAGARIFIEVGPRNVLSGLASSILADRAHVSVAMDQPGKPGLTQLLQAIATLVTEGVAVDHDRLFQGRTVERIELAKLTPETGKPQYSPSTWLVNGGHARPAINGDAKKAVLPPIEIAIGAGGDEHSAKETVEATTEASSRIPPQNGTASNSGPILSTNGSRDQNGHGEASLNAGTAIPTASRRGDRGMQDQEVPDKSMQISREGNRMHANSTSTAGQMESQTAENRAISVAPERSLELHHGVSNDGTASVMIHHQHVMQQFLETQRRVMLAYLDPLRMNGSESGANGHSISGTANHYVTQASSVAPSWVGPEVAEAPAQDAEIEPASNGSRIPPAPHPSDSRVEPASAPVSSFSSTPADESPATPAKATQEPEPPAPEAEQTKRAQTLDRDEITSQLLQTVSERTGYPPEMLDLEADLEADLGIDSIKRVEIAGTMLQSLPLPEGITPDLEELTASRTLREVVDGLEALVGSATSELAEATAVKDDDRPFDLEPAGDHIGRFIVQPVHANPDSTIAGLASEGVIVIVDDEMGVASQLAIELEKQDHLVIRLVSGDQEQASEPDSLFVDLADADSVHAAARDLRDRFDRVKALIHLAPLRAQSPRSGNNFDAWRDRVDHDVIGLFLLLQAFQEDLESAAQAGGAAILGVTAMGGTFGNTDSGRSFLPDQGAISGLLKTVAHEWPEVRTRAIDVDDPANIVDHLIAELFTADEIVEVGYKANQRIALDSLLAPLDGRPDSTPIDRNSVVLLTGGARGITAEAALRIAERYQPALILVGRTTLSSGEEPETANLIEPMELRRAILERRKRSDQEITPAAVEREFRQLMGEREIRETLAKLQQYGSRAEYHACDVRDSNAFGTLIDNIYATHGRLDGVVHGAGIIEDKLIQDKQLDSFKRVVSTKVDSAYTLAAKLHPEQLRFLVMFSSVSGRFGNRGQADYAAASEILNKLAQHLDRKWPGHIVSINWGPWLTKGMVSPEVQRQFASRGVELIPVETGCRLLLEELSFGRKGEVEIVVGGSTDTDKQNQPLGVPRRSGPVNRSETVSEENGTDSLPLTASGEVLRHGEDGLVVLRTLDTNHDLYLNHHVIDGRPVFPFAMSVELMAEVAGLAAPGMEVAKLSAVRMLSGIVLSDSKQALRVTARSDSTQSAADRVLDMSIRSAAGQERIYYSSQVELRHPSKTEVMTGGTFSSIEDVLPARLEPFPIAVDEAYERYLFHGPLFQGIASIDGISQEGTLATLRPSNPANCLRDAQAGAWLIDPVVLDSALQMQVLWARLHWDITLLPVEAESYQRNVQALDKTERGSPETNESGAIRHVMRIRPTSQNPLCYADHFFFDARGKLFGRLTNMSGAGSKALNRLADTPSSN